MRDCLIDTQLIPLNITFVPYTKSLTFLLKLLIRPSICDPLGLCKRTIVIEMAEFGFSVGVCRNVKIADIDFCFSAGEQPTSGAQAATSLSTAAGEPLSLFLSSIFRQHFYHFSAICYAKTFTYTCRDHQKLLSLFC